MQVSICWELFSFRNTCTTIPAILLRMEIQVFRNANSSQTKAYSHYSNYSYSGLIPNERALNQSYHDDTANRNVVVR